MAVKWPGIAFLSDTSMQQPNGAVSTPLGWIFKRRCKKATFIHLESHTTGAQGVCSRSENIAIYRYIKATKTTTTNKLTNKKPTHNNNNNHCKLPKKFHQPLLKN